MTAVPRLLVALLAALLLAGAAAPSASAATTAQRLVSIARGELAKGVREVPDGSNRHPAIRRYVSSTTPSWFGAPWCAYFVSWVARQAGVPIGPGGRGLGYVPYVVQWAKRTGRWKRRPRPGYLVTWPNHIGMVETVAPDGSFTTIEGNSANAVRRRWRRAGDAQGFVALAAGGPVTRGVPRKAKPRPRRREAPLRARITAYPSATLRVGERLELSANDSSGPVERVHWDLDGDGRFDDARGDTATMRVVRAGRFPVTVRVTSPRGRTATARTTITVLGVRAPVARLRAPAKAEVGEQVQLDASGTSDPAGRGLRFAWDLEGDGSFEEGPPVRVAEFAQPGVHLVAVRVTDAGGAVVEARRPITVVPARRPAVTLTCDPTVPTGTAVRCTADTSASTTRIRRVEWDSDGDGGFGAGGLRASWTFTTPGRRDVRVRVTGEDGGQAEAAAAVDVTNRAPVAALALPTWAVVGEELRLDASAARDPDGRLEAVRWDVGGDGTWDAEGARAAVRPAATGALLVVVEVRDEHGATARAEGTVTVRELPRAAVRVLTASPLAGLPVQLSPEGSTPDATCQWDLDGDGDTDQRAACTQAVEVSYRRRGTRTVVLTVVDPAGRRATASATVVVG